MEKKYFALAYYGVCKVCNPNEEIALHKVFFKNKDITSRIYISENGINGQMSAEESDATLYMEWLTSRPDFTNIKFKIHVINENIFPKQTVKYRKQLVAIDYDVDLEKRGAHVPPAEWKKMLNTHKGLLIDVRNNYEWKVGYFKGATLPDLNSFREFPAYVDGLLDTHDPKTTPIMMYCTGGIRCEWFSALMIAKGFEEIYQLDGGVIAYGNEVGSDGWEGKLFVFDDRMAIQISNDHLNPISECTHCNKECDLYHNCANALCNKLFISCNECTIDHACCCQATCKDSTKLREYSLSQGCKPFRRTTNYHNCEANISA